MRHITRKAENMFLELNYYEPSKQDKFSNWLLSQHLHIAFLFFFSLGGGCCWFAGCQVEVSYGGKVYEKQPGRESAGQNHTGRKRAAASTYEVKQTVWLLSLGRPCWRVPWFLSFPPRCLLSLLFCFLLAHLFFFFFLCTAFGMCVCVFH